MGLEMIILSKQNRYRFVLTKDIECVWYCDSCYCCDFKKVIL